MLARVRDRWPAPGCAGGVRVQLAGPPGLRKTGFVYEGTKRQSLLWYWAWIDADVMSILGLEWAAHRGYPAVRGR